MRGRLAVLATTPDAALFDLAQRALCAAMDAMRTGAPIAMAYDDFVAADAALDELARRVATRQVQAQVQAQPRPIDAVIETTRALSIAWSKVGAFPGVERDRARRIERELEELLRELPRSPR